LAWPFTAGCGAATVLLRKPADGLDCADVIADFAAGFLTVGGVDTAALPVDFLAASFAAADFFGAAVFEFMFRDCFAATFRAVVDVVLNF